MNSLFIVLHSNRGNTILSEITFRKTVVEAGRPGGEISRPVLTTTGVSQGGTPIWLSLILHSASRLYAQRFC